MTTTNTATNVLGEPLALCGCEPKTGFFRDGYCNTNSEDLGSHTICAVLTEKFLNFSAQKGNDLTTPMPAFNFQGLKPGDKWCLCAARWLEAYYANKAPPVVLQACHKKALDTVYLQQLKSHAYQ